MRNVYFVLLAIGTPTALFFLLRWVLLRALAKPRVPGEVVLTTVAISSFGTAIGHVTGYPVTMHWDRLIEDPVRLLLVLVGFAFCAVSVMAYRQDRLRLLHEPPPPPGEAISHYVQVYANHYQLYGLGLAMILIGV